MVTQDEILKALSQFIDPYLKQDWVSSQAVQHCQIENSQVNIQIVVGYPVTDHESLVASAVAHLQQQWPQYQFNLTISQKITAHVAQLPQLSHHPEVKNIIAVASGKGGVGKSTVAMNLAFALKNLGAEVGILDADVHGPNQPIMLGATPAASLKTAEGLKPLLRNGIQSMSMGYLVDSKVPVIWRGPMISQALTQLLYETQWQNLDYLVIDLPPGTGDIQLTLSQKIPVVGSLIVTTPQSVALADARKALAMFQKMNIRILGVVENMSSHLCSHCGHSENIFGEGGGMRLAEETDTEFLGALPLDGHIRALADVGLSLVTADPSSAGAQTYRHIAQRVAGKISLLPKYYGAKIPSVVIE